MPRALRRRRPRKRPAQQARAAAQEEEAARREQEWQLDLAALRERFPADHPASRPEISLAEAEAEAQQAEAAAEDEARHAYDPSDPEGLAAYAAYHGEQARVHAWNIILDDAGVGRLEPEAGQTPASPERDSSAERSVILTRLRETERLLDGVMHQTLLGSDARELRSRWESMRLAQSRLRRVQADIDVFAHSLPDDIAALEGEQRRLEDIPGQLEDIPGLQELPFADPAMASFREDRIQLAQSRLAEVRAKIAALRDQWAREHAATRRQLTAQQRRLEDTLARDETLQAAHELTGDGSPSEILADRIGLVRTWLGQLEAQLTRLAAWNPGTPPPAASKQMPGQDRPAGDERAPGQRTSSQRTSGRASPARPRTAQQRIKAIRTARERDWQHWLTAARQSHPAARPAARPDLSQADAYAEYQRAVPAAVLAAREAYRNAGDRDGRDASIESQAEQAHLSVRAALQADLGIDVPATELEEQLLLGAPIDPETLPPNRPGLTMADAAAWVQQQATAATAGALKSWPGAAGTPEHTAYVNLETERATEQAWSALLSELGTVPDLRVPKIMVTAPDDHVSESDGPEVDPVLLSATAPPPGTVATMLSEPPGSPSHEQVALAAPRVAGFTTLVALNRNGKISDGEADLEPAQVAARLGLHLPGAGPDGLPVPVPENPVGVIMITSSSPQAGAELHRATGLTHMVISQDREPVMLGTEVLSGTVAGDDFTADGQWVIHAGGHKYRTGTPSLTEALKLVSSRPLEQATPDTGEPATTDQASAPAERPTPTRTPAPAPGASLLQRITDLPASDLTLPHRDLTWLRAPHDSVRHAQAAMAAPRVAGFKTLIAHGRNGRAVDGDTTLDGPELAARLDLHIAADRPGATPSAPPDDPAGVSMLSCDIPGTALELHRSTGGVHQVLFPSHKAIILPTGEVISGGFGTTAAGRSVPAANGQWLALVRGELLELGTPFLGEASAALGLELLPGAEPPDRPVAFYADLAEAQTAVLAKARLETPQADDASGFLPSLIALAGDQLRGMKGAESAADLAPLVVGAMAERYGRGGQPDRRYDRYLSGSLTADEMLAGLRSGNLDSRAERLLPHLAADTFGLELAVLGDQAQVSFVGEPGGQRMARPDRTPFVLVRTSDGQFWPALPITDLAPDESPRTELLRRPPRQAPAADQPTVWTGELSDADRQLTRQEAWAVPLPPEAPDAAVARRMAETQYLAQVGHRPGRSPWLRTRSR